MPRSSRSPLYAIVVVLAGCTAHAPFGGKPVLSVQVDVLSTDGQQISKLRVDHHLPPEARYSVKALAGAPAYLYLVRKTDQAPLLVSASGSMAPHVAGGTPAYFPAEGTWFPPSTQSGDEELTLVAAPAPLDEAQVLAAAQRSTSSTSSAPAKAASSSTVRRGDPTPPVGEKGRGDQIVLIAQDPNGVTVVHFPFKH